MGWGGVGKAGSFSNYSVACRRGECLLMSILRSFRGIPFSFMKPKEKLMFSFLCGILLQLSEVEFVMERPMALWVEGAVVEEWPTIGDGSQRSTHLSRLQRVP